MSHDTRKAQPQFAHQQESGESAFTSSKRTMSPPVTSLTAAPLQAKMASGPVQRQEDPNDILDVMTTSGAGRETTKQDGAHHTDYGVDASERMAETDQERIVQHADLFVEVANSHGLPPALLAAIASRETRGRNLLFGDHGNGVGMMQVDVRYHPDRAEAIRNAANERDQIRLGIQYGAQILADSLAGVQEKHPTWSPAWQLRGAVAAYNFGVSNVGSMARLDVGSTGDDYSADVWARARYYAQFSEFGSSATVEEAANAAPEASQEESGGILGWIGEKVEDAAEVVGDIAEKVGDIAECVGDTVNNAGEMISDALEWLTGGEGTKESSGGESKSGSSESDLPQFQETITLSGSVGAGGENKPADVRKVMAKLNHLGYLSDPAFRNEATKVAALPAGSGVPDNQINLTIMGIRAFQSHQTSGFTPDGLISPGYSTLRTLNQNVLRADVGQNQTAGAEAAEGANSWDVTAAVAHLNANAHANSTGYCARYVRRAINAGGVATPNNPISAYQYNGYLEQFGFVQVAAGSYQAGDIAVIENFGNHRHGHIQMYNGSQWISDFRQRDFWPGSSYRTTQPPFVIYRMP